MSDDQLALFVARRHAGTVLGIEPATLARRSDVGASAVAAEEAVVSGRAETEALAVLEALRLHPGATRRELAARTVAIGARLSQDREAWAYTCGRRLTTLEDRKLARAVVHRPSIRRPQREVRADLEPCAEAGVLSIRWWAKEGGR